MGSVQKSVLVPYSTEQMFELVNRIEDYPRFLPWCGSASVLERSDNETVARLEIRYHGVHAHFTTANRIEPPDRIVIRLRSGPFRRLDGTWRFTALSAAGSKVELSLGYEFAGGVLARLIEPVFNRIAHSLVDAFVRRAEEIYAPSTPSTGATP
jgi:ribosome-associated toxin RatA of RatAB toxin-antitoxin module